MVSSWIQAKDARISPLFLHVLADRSPAYGNTITIPVLTVTGSIYPGFAPVLP
jgi:hypothetical protein